MEALHVNGLCNTLPNVQEDAIRKDRRGSSLSLL